MSTDGFLHRYFLDHHGPVIHKWLHYFDIYETHFSRYRGTDVRFLEIGVGGGGSQQMWREYFGRDASINCLDVQDLSSRVDPAVSRFYEGSQTDTKVLDRIVEENGGLDIVLDDGSHVNSHMIATFEHLYPQMAPYGVYVVEDANSAYSPRHEGGYRRPGTFLEYVKDLVDHINFFYIKELPNDDAFGCSTYSMNIYDSVVVFERRPKAHVQWLVTGVHGSLGDGPWMPRPPVWG